MATEVVYVRVSPDTKRRIDALVEASAGTWPRLTMQSIVAGFIQAGLDRVDEAKAAEAKANKGNRVVKGPQLALPKRRVTGAQVREAAKRRAGGR